ncbi:cytosolic phospholipase A2 gamma [Rhinichthys klamathensis goyatoka]|uniref:cytosolic phospholipase A2 gamma n=1 Tax=Rhinichthys klamathensis goyatoka TaxID=3034132 RepID=UPI0024B4EBA2|nr:cytosolic phospholipase A2 gamma [Rhinichthys klamathensis goyatoka]
MFIHGGTSPDCDLSPTVAGEEDQNPLLLELFMTESFCHDPHTGKQGGEVRIESSLNKNEEEFVARRRNSVLQSLKKLQIKCMVCVFQNEVPNIALLGSGGGQRAMVGLLGSLVQLQKTSSLLDCVLYLSGVSGSTWCMASLYQEPDWSTKLEAVKDKILQRLSGPGVSWTDALAKLKKYYYGKDFFSMTDIWAVMVVTAYVKEIDEHTLTEQWSQQSKDPLPIYTVIDKQGKQLNEGDPWFEITPHEAGYSLTGAFVDASNFGSQFHKGSKKNKQDEFDMLYLQEQQQLKALCTSTLADEDDIKKQILQKIKEQDKRRQEGLRREKGTGSGKDFAAGLNLGPPEALLHNISERSQPDPNSPATDQCYQELMKIVDMNLSVSTALDESIRTTLTDEAVHSTLSESETRDFEDAGILLNAPYFSVLRKERNIDLIISLDFSESDPFMTVKDTAKTCREQNIPFPEVNFASEDSQKPKDFYVFKGQNTPTVIHIPLFNVVNCGDKIEDWRKKYRTFQGPYSADMITDLMEVAGKNISNNKAKVLKEIRTIIGQKRSRH